MAPVPLDFHSQGSVTTDNGAETHKSDQVGIESHKGKTLFQPAPTIPKDFWSFSPRQIAVRLFLTCWVVFSLHFATNTVREIYLGLTIGDHFSFQVDEYAHLHPDLFEKKGYGWHIGSNPGSSMVAAIPYAVFRPIIDQIVDVVQKKRLASGQTKLPEYHSPWPQSRSFYQESWRRGLDVKFGLAAFVMQAFCMALSSAVGVVCLFYVLRQVFGSDKKALGLSLLYAFGTAVFFRTGYLNHNLMLGHIAFFGFLAMWNPGRIEKFSGKWRFFVGGITGGTALLFDYSGVVFLLGLFAYGLVSQWVKNSRQEAFRLGMWYILGTVGPVCLLWFYQWQSFGHPFYPGQHWMPPVEWIDRGYQGFSFPQWELLQSLVFDYRYGLFVSSPVFLLALLSPWFNRGVHQRLPWLELTTILSIFLVLLVFFSCVNYARLQYNTGIRYLTPIFPFLFLPTAIVLMRMSSTVVYLIAAMSVAQAWALAMYRDVEQGLGVLDPILQVFFGGFKLPALTTLSRLSDQFGTYFENGPSPLPLFVLTGAIIFVIWTPRVARLTK